MPNGNLKGKRGERELAEKLTEIFGTKCRRGQQYCGIEGKDVVGLPGIHIECKRTERLNLFDAMSQAANDAAYGEIPIVCHRKNHEEWMAVVFLKDLPHLAKILTTIAGD